jgi:hypothetical protein
MPEAIYEVPSPAATEVLLTLPIDGAWMPGAEPYTDIIGEMLDDNSPLIEEDRLPEDNDGPWRVRLTAVGIAAVT